MSFVVGTAGNPELAFDQLAPPSTDHRTRIAVPMGTSLPTYIVVLLANASVALKPGHGAARVAKLRLVQVWPASVVI